MNKTMTLLISAMVLIIATVAVLTMANTRLTQFQESGNESSKSIGCQKYKQQALFGEGEVPSNPACETNTEEIKERKGIANALSELS